MKAPFLLALVASAALLCAPERAHGGRISIYSDAVLADCTLSDTAPATVNIYVGEWSLEATGLRFRIAESAGFTGVWLGESSPFVTIGSSRTDLSIGLGSCMMGEFLVLTMQYQMFGTSTCSTLSIAAAPGFPEPICTYCLFGEWPCYGYDPLYVNCSGPINCNPVATEPSTWGRVKALYRN